MIIVMKINIINWFFLKGKKLLNINFLFYNLIYVISEKYDM